MLACSGRARSKVRKDRVRLYRYRHRAESASGQDLGKGTGCSATAHRGRPSAHQSALRARYSRNSPPLHRARCKLRAAQRSKRSSQRSERSSQRSKRSPLALIRARGPSGDGDAARDVNVMVGVARGRHELKELLPESRLRGEEGG